ncbi:MAG: preprotein translocase subunit SecA [Phycisphaerales bacterium]|nr:preprotein translocase subunit SecA [Phycisphaerales bacterium]
MPIPVLDYVIRKTFGTQNQRMVRRYLRIVDKVNALEPTFAAMTDTQLREMTPLFRARVTKGERPYDMIPEIFACAREAMDRAVGIRNIFNPALGFDPTRLPEPARQAFMETRAAMDAMAPREPSGDLRGCQGDIAGWQLLDIPLVVYQAIRELLPESRPPFRARPFDVQIIGGIVLSEGRIAEMKTGEGKTIVGPLACYLAACEEKQVHVVTVNDYLVQRDRDWTFPFYRAVGLTVGAIHPMHMQRHGDKVVAYSCDVLYGTTSEFGFDYLRDNMKVRASDQVQKHRQFAIVDEVDSTLIDEARTPLIISGQAFNQQPRYDLANRLALHLVTKQGEWQSADERVKHCQAQIAGAEGDIRNARDKSSVPAIKKRLDDARKQLPVNERERDRFTQYYELEMDKKRATLTHEGVEEAQRDAKIGSFYVGENMDMPHLLEQSVRAHTVYQGDRDYVVAPDEDGQLGVVIVDQNTGRKMVGRQWSDGLHQAVEAKEGVRIKEETQTMATITIQNYFKLYERLSGMTGTADTEATEFHEIYRLSVVSIPTNVAAVRVDRQDLVFISQKDKWERIVDVIERIHDTGAPVLVGTTSVAKSEVLSRMLTEKHGIRHEVLNAKQHEREADIIQSAGQLGAVMIATNMAGRGTDIKLGQIDTVALVEHWKRRNIAPREADANLGEVACIALIHRHLAGRFLEIGKKELEAMDDATIRTALLRYWVAEQRDLTAKKIESLSDSLLERELDAAGWSMHRLRFFTSVNELGGLHIVGTERHESRRIDNQLRGRSGRQGDQGQSRFFLALDDELMKMFAGKTTLNVLSRFGMKEGDSIEAPMLSRAVESAQRKVEERNFQIRKTILDYDEPMEVQRRDFYGRRQPILEGRGIKQAVFAFIDEAVADAVAIYLSPLHVPGTISQWVWEAFGVMIDAERFKGKDREQVLKTVTVDTLEEASGQITVTIGEYIPDDSDPAEWDRAGVIEWAMKSYGAVITDEVIDAEGRQGVVQRLEAAVQERYAKIDLSPLEPFLQPGYGARDLLHWAQRMLGTPLDEALLEGIREPHEATARLRTAIHDAYGRRELEYPIDFAIEFVNLNIQAFPEPALTQFCGWARGRYELDWNPRSLPSTDPAELKKLLLAEARTWDAQRISDRVTRVLASLTNADGSPVADPEQRTAAIEHWVQQTLFVRLTPSERAEVSADPVAFLNQRFARLLREELEQFERFVLLQILDQAWKDHLHAMDQTRDSISFRSFSQKDPRIEFKKESSRHFGEMLASIRERVTDLVFKGKLSPQQMRPPTPAVAQIGASTGAPSATQSANSATDATSAAPVGTGSELPAGAPIAAVVPTQAQERDIAIADRAGTPPARSAAALAGTTTNMTRPRVVVAPDAPSAVGRNEPCPCGSGKKYKQCCGKK